jgi:phage tail sheath protein FI
MPGVVISTAVRTGPSATTVRESSQLFVVGKAQRGPADEAVLIESIADFEAKFGGYLSSSYLHPTVETFFEEGGTQCYVARTVGASATVGTLDLDDSSSATVLTIDANGPGVWSADVEVEVEEVVAGTSFRVNLYYQNSPLPVYSTGTVTSAAQAAGRINLSAVATQYVTATAADGATTLPDAIAATALSTGAAGSSVVVGDYVDSLDLFNGALGSGAVTCPEISNSTMHDALIAHANTNSRIAILHDVENASIAAVKVTAVALQGGDNAEHAALYFPWIEVPTTINGVTRFIPPVGYVAAKRATAHNQTGSHVPAAGLLSASRFVTGVKTDIDKTNGDSLDDAGVNAIRVIQNSVRIYGARSLSADDENFRYITAQDTVNHVVIEAGRSLEDLVFSTIDGRNTIFSAIESRLIAILSPLRDIGALFEAYDANGRKIDSGFTVRCDAKLNPVSQLAGGTVKAKVGLRVSSVGDKIEVDIIKSNLTASVV